jgi:putative protein kinase ArgK-like GTPase of G3E family
VENTERALRSTLELAHPTKRVIHHHGRRMNVDVILPKEHRDDASEAMNLSRSARDSSPSSTAQSDMSMWIPPILKAVSTEGTGIPEVAEAIARHKSHLHNSGDWSARDRARLRSELEAVLQEALMSRFLNGVHREEFEQVLEKVIRRDISPYEAVSHLLNGKLK